MGAGEAACRITAGAPAREGGGGGGGGAAGRGAAGAAVPAETGGLPGARVGNLIVGAEVGLGGKLMRTVSFLG